MLKKTVYDLWDAVDTIWGSCFPGIPFGSFTTFMLSSCKFDVAGLGKLKITCGRRSCLLLAQRERRLGRAAEGWYGGAALI